LQPILLGRFRGILKKRGPTAARTPETRLDQNGSDEIFYVPFEHVNPKARIVIVGITPGPNQIKATYGTVHRLLQAGTPDDVVLAEAKREGSFGSPTMRPNLIRMLDELGFHDLLGLRSCAELWGEAFDLLHATSVVPNAAFRNGKPFAGRFQDVLRSPTFRREFERHFVPSLASLPKTSLYVALGPTPLAALDWCAEHGHLDAGQIMGALAHPSTSGGSQVDVYLGKKSVEDLSERNPVIHRVADLQARADRMRTAVARIRSGTPTAPRAPTSSHPLTPAKSAHSPAPMRSTKPAARRSGVPGTGDVDPHLRAVFERAGYTCVKDTVKKVALFVGRISGREVYLINGRPTITVVVHPDQMTWVKAAVREPASAVTSDLFHHDNLRTFPARDHGGVNPVRYGRAVTCRTMGALEQFLAAFDAA
jgi:hypothetical protein